MPTLSSFIDLSSEEQQSRGLQYTPAEIAQQPQTWRRTLAIFREERDRLAAFLEQVGIRDAVETRPAVILAGAGTSDYIGQALVLLLREQWGCEVSAVASTDLLINMDEWLIPGKRYLCISFSRSGNSPEAVAVLEHAIERHPEVAHLVVTCNSRARMLELCSSARHASSVILDDAVNDRSLAMTSSFTNMVLLGQCLAHTWSLADYEPIHASLVAAGEEMLRSAAPVADRLAAQGLERACFIGSGALASVARESALKVLEMTAGGVATLSETVLGLRHGPMAALNSKTLFVCFVPSDPRRTLYARDLLREVGEKGVVAARIAVGPSALASVYTDAADTFLAFNEGTGAAEVTDLYSPVVDVIFGQLLGLFCSVARGLHPDAPSPGGVITRVVQPFQIH